MEKSLMESESKRLVVVGAGTAGAELAIQARQCGWAGTITVFGEEPSEPYHRPPLSKEYLCGGVTVEQLAIRHGSIYEKMRIDFHLNAAVSHIDRTSQMIELPDGTRHSYDCLALCTGGRPRTLQFEGMDNASPVNLIYLRSRMHADSIRILLGTHRRLLIIGGGYIGLEVAASARTMGLSVTVLEAQQRVLMRSTGPEMSNFFERLHRENGVLLHTGMHVARVRMDPTSNRIQSIVCEDGSVFEVDVVLVGAGMLPNVALAEAAGLDVDRGVVVDSQMRTSDTHIWAAGDCTVFDSLLYKRRLRLESVPNAIEQAKTAAASICGQPNKPAALPWFWSDQYGLKLQIAGLSEGYDEFVMRGSRQSRSFIGLYLRAKRLIAADVVNRPAEFLTVKRLIDSATVLPAAQWTDETIPLKQLLATRSPIKAPSPHA